MANSRPNAGVSVRRLPVYSWPLQSPVMQGGRIETPNGLLTQVLNGASIRFVAVVEFHAGRPHGGHLHPQRDEYVYIQRGNIDLVVEDPVTRERRTRQLESGDLVHITAGVPHVYLGQTDGLAVEMSTQAYEPDGTVAYDFGPSST